MSPPPRPARGDAVRVLVLATVWILFYVLIDPRGAPDQTLRFAGISVGGLGAAGVYALARRWRASPDASLLAALTLAASPLYAAMSVTARVDVTTAVVTLAALFAFLRGRERRQAAWLAASSCLIALAGFNRQTCFLCAAGGALALAREGRLGLAEASGLLGPALAAAAFFCRIDAPSWLRPADALAVAARAVRAFDLAALCLFPLAAAATLRARRAAATHWEKLILVLIGVASAVLWFRARGFDVPPNTFHRGGLGALTIGGASAKESGWWSSALFWHAAAAVGCVSALIFARSAFEAARGESGAEIVAAALFSGVPFAATLLQRASYDSGLLVVLPATAAAAVAGMRGRVWRLAPAFACWLGLALISSAGLEDYFAWNRARWQAEMTAVALGQNRGVETFSPGPPREGLAPLALVPYRSLLAPDGAAVYVYGDPARMSGKGGAP